MHVGVVVCTVSGRMYWTEVHVGVGVVQIPPRLSSPRHTVGSAAQIRSLVSVASSKTWPLHVVRFRHSKKLELVRAAYCSVSQMMPVEKLETLHDAPSGSRTNPVLHKQALSSGKIAGTVMCSHIVNGLHPGGNANFPAAIKGASGT